MIASLKLNDHNYDVWLFDQQFNIPTGWNGLPHSSFVGDGQLRLFMTTPEDNYILLKFPTPLFHGYFNQTALRIPMNVSR